MCAQVTLSLHLKLSRFTSHIPLLNYAVEGANEELFVGECGMGWTKEGQ